MPPLGLILGVGLGLLFFQFLPENDEIFGGVGFYIACYQLPGLYFLLGITLILSYPKIQSRLHGMILGAVFSLPALLFIFFEFNGFRIQVIALWVLLFTLSGLCAGLILERMMKLFGHDAKPSSPKAQ